MKKLLILLIAIISISFTACNKEQVVTEPEFIKKTSNYISGDKLFELQGDARRVQRGSVIFEILQEKYRNQYPLVDSLKLTLVGACKCTSGRKNSIYLQVNEKNCIPLTTKLLNKEENVFGPNSSYTLAEQVVMYNHAACANQLKDFERAFVDALNGLIINTKTVLVKNPKYVAPIVTASTDNWVIPNWLKQLLVALGIIALLLLIRALINGFRSSKTDTTSVVESKTKECCDGCKSDCCENCNPCIALEKSANAFIKASEAGKDVAIDHKHGNLSVSFRSIEPEDYLPISIEVRDSNKDKTDGEK